MSKWTALAEQIHRTSEMAGLGSAQSARSPENRFVALVAPLGFPVSEVEATNDARLEGRAVTSVTAENDETAGKATSEPLSDPAVEARRQRVLAMLAERPGIRYAVVVDNPDTDPALVSVGIRDVATFELAIPAPKFDSFTLIDLIGRYGGVTVH